jgi:hypothetical protein
MKITDQWKCSGQARYNGLYTELVPSWTVFNLLLRIGSSSFILHCKV